MKSNLKNDEQREFSFSDREFTFLANLVSDRTGIVLTKNKKNMVYSRLVRRLRALHLSSFAEYCALLQSGAGDVEMGNLVNAITTNLTSFFREKHHFEHLRESVLLPLCSSSEKSTQKKLRIWSAACSAGMEPYSIAMIVKSTISDLSGWDARILATDIDTNMLVTGRSGEYSSEQLANIPQPYHADIRKEDNKIIMSDRLREIISFKQLNLLEKWPMSGLFDAVFCRNVVIYFDKPTQKILFNRIADLIKPDGYMYIGHSENLHNVCDRFELLGKTIYRKIR
ncbi:MAG: protein-glutamate O-methyltransferase [Rickettsiales bacterium]